MGGGGGRPEAASRAAAEASYAYLATTKKETTIQELENNLRKAFTLARQAVNEHGEGGSTVATVIKIIELQGKPVVGIAHAGDTRLFAYNKESRRSTGLTPDQSFGNRVTNGLISGYSENRQEHQDDIYTSVVLDRGTRLMLCSDGITGDFEDQFLSEDDMQTAFAQTTPGAAAKHFLRISKKDDDKTIIIADLV